MGLPKKIDYKVKETSTKTKYYTQRHKECKCSLTEGLCIYCSNAVWKIRKSEEEEDEFFEENNIIFRNVTEYRRSTGDERDTY